MLLEPGLYAVNVKWKLLRFAVQTMDTASRTELV
jgi:hypothetical protein